MSSKFSLPTEAKKSSKSVDTAALEAFTAGAKDRRQGLGQRPWDEHDQNEAPKHNVSIRLNEYHLEMLRYLSKSMDISQQKILRKHVLPVIEELAEETYKEANK
jgi:hypothetical protein